MQLICMEGWLTCHLLWFPGCCHMASPLQALALPPAVAAEVDMASLMLRAQPFTDADALLPICYRCQATNALLNTQVSCVGVGATCIYLRDAVHALPMHNLARGRNHVSALLSCIMLAYM
jgi:hypothetical protein